MTQYWNTKPKQDFANVNITGGTITGISALQIPEGGTGGTTITEAQTNLSLLPGTDIAALVGGKIQQVNLPAIAISDTFTVNTEAAMLALSAQTGDVAIRLELSKSFILAGTDPSQLADWQELLSPTDAVQSVNGLTGTVVISDIPELSTARNLSSSGDVSWSVLFDGSADVDAIATVATNSISNLKLADMTAGTIKGAIALGDPQDLSSTQVRTLLNVADGATANSTDATLLSRANHTGTQAGTTVSYNNLASGLTAGEVQGAIDELDGVLDNLVVGTDVQAFSVELDAIAGLTSSANQLPLFTGLGTASLLPISAYVQGLLGNADAPAALATLGITNVVLGTTSGYTIQYLTQAEYDAIVTKDPNRRYYITDGSSTLALANISDAGSMASQNASAVFITGGSVTGVTDITIADGGTGASTAATARTNLGVVSGTFTPVLRTVSDATEPTYTSRSGRFLKWDNWVQVQISIVCSSTIATGSGNLQITGLPYTNTTSIAVPAGRQSAFTGITAGLLNAFLPASSSAIQIESDGAGNLITFSAIASGSTISLSLSYLV